ncbi:MAG TPA: SDR family NAD(P)-dependent oxidoreductase, partial [Terriglobales bacterium]|nr:SDR family NAD(P)-dependent oxidoreductase [Terriglobales bacterium]
MESGLKNKVVLLTGSSEGIALAAAQAFAAEGARLAMCSRSESKLQKAADDIRSRYRVQVHSEVVDVTDFPAV